MDLVEASRWGVDPTLWDDIVDSLRAEMGEPFVNARLARKNIANIEYVEGRRAGLSPADAARASSGYEQFHGEYAAKFSWQPIEAWYYHGGTD